MITESHRKKAFALMNEISDHCGYESKGQFYANVIKPAYNKAHDTDFSLKAGECKLDEYDRFLEFVLDIALDVGVQFSQSPKNRFNSTERYLILMIKNRTCCITGTPNADLHHCDCIGMGNNRDEVDNSKIPRMALSREKHQECGQIGQEAFDRKYHVHGVLCNYHNDVWDDEEPTAIHDTKNIKTMRYSQEKGYLGIQFKVPVPGCNEKAVIVYKMTDAEYEVMASAPEPMEYFMNHVYGQCEIVQL